MPPTEPSKPRAGFIGLGAMGSRMAGRILAAKYPLTVYNRTPAKTEPFKARGAAVAASPADLAAQVDIVISILADDEAVESTYYGPTGVLAGAKEGTILCEMSTIYPATSRQLHEAAAVKGLLTLDAPVSGSTPQAEQGQLVVFVGGDEGTYTICKPIFDVLAQAAHFMGPAGSGNITKLCVNTLLGLGIQAIAEAVTLGQKAGLDRARLVNVLGQTSVVSPSQKAKLQNAARDSYPATFPVSLMFKDFRLIERLATAHIVPMPTAAAAEQICAAECAREQADGIDDDFSAVIRTMQSLAAVAPRP